MKLNKVLRFYQRYYRNLTARALKAIRTSGIITRFYIATCVFLFAYLTPMLPTTIKLILFVLVLIPYIRINLTKTRLFVRLYKKIKSNIFIGIKNTEVDLRARRRLLRKIFPLILSYIIIFVTLLNWTVGTNFILRTHWLNSIVAITAVLGIVFYSFAFLALRRKRLLIPLLSMTSPFITLSLLLHVLHSVNILLSKITGIKYNVTFNSNFDSFIYMFLESGTDKKFALLNFIYSFTFQLIYVFVQPVYKLEKSRLALETIAVIYGAASVIGLLLAAPVTHYLYEYLLISSPDGKNLLLYAGISTSEDFRNFYEQTLKFVILPFSLGTTIPILMIKYRESSSKSRGQSVFDRACENPYMTANTMIPLLREALYYGGGSIRSAIYSHHYLHIYTPSLYAFQSNRKSMRYKLRSRILSIYYMVLNKLNR